MELRHLRYFIAVAEERNFSRAAVRLNIAQPPLSQQIRRLERDLGFDLFIRTPKGVVPTRAGEVLLKHARIVLESSAVAIAAAEAAQRGVVVRLTIAFFNSAAYTILPKLLKAYRAAQPGVEVEVREMVIADQIDALIEGHIDVGILRPPVMDTRVDMLRLTREPFVVALPADHKLAAKRRLSLADVSNQRLVSYPYGHLTGFRERTDAAFVAAGVTATTLYEATQIHTICGLVASGAAMAIVRASARVLRMEGLRFVPLSGSGLVAETWLGWRKQNSIVQLKSFVDVAQSLIDRP